MSRAILLIAHGNKRPETRDHFLKMADAVAERAQCTVGVVFLASADAFEVQFAAYAESWTTMAVETVDVVPLLLGPGQHLEHDVPAIGEHLVQAYPQWTINTIPMLGAWPALSQLIAEAVQTHL